MRLVLLLLVTVAYAVVYCQRFVSAPEFIAEEVPRVRGDSIFGDNHKATQFLKSGVVDLEKGTITLPLHLGRMKKKREYVWYIITDANDKGAAQLLGVNYSVRLSYADVSKGARRAFVNKLGELIFQFGYVDFSPKHEVVEGNDRVFPPKKAKPGSIGKNDYSPVVIVSTGGNKIYNAPMIAFNVSVSDLVFEDGEINYDIVHDRVVAIDPYKRTVTLKLSLGFIDSQPVYYFSMDASDPGIAALESATHAHGLTEIPIGREFLTFSATTPSVHFTNGHDGLESPHRQGYNSALREQVRIRKKGSSKFCQQPGHCSVLKETNPMTIFSANPWTSVAYSPLCDVYLAEWTGEALKKSYRARLTSYESVENFVELGLLSGPLGGNFGSGKIILNAPIAYSFG